ncbi:ATP-binding cassette domain-containing protein [Goodfellowiella coeruleoviolacea]|uniref:ABC-2 type transport system ATP-binding protein n=1 Tax=Goodfellowiella coeruleoviolacea TaxID=334858 RepID=A0AAE3GMM1_9PSEU|nr:ATP-binding cassette domain-containing protein [Goodfellowiella coeruleoviolacea]MCP2170064.1 ABC-2 type transport system ATP-binding protein [Goodfellowiella coeruleoviolacea]
MTDPIIETHDLTRVFDGVRALDRVSLSVPRGTVLGLLGHNGAGKTTLVNILATLLPPTSGTARVAGLDVVARSRDVRARIGLTGQFAAVEEQLSGMDNLVLVAKLLGARSAQARRRADELLERFELTSAAHRRVRTYSGGMRRRLDLAVSLVGRPDVIFLDEPSTGLDPASRIELWRIVAELVTEGATVLLTTQYLEEADRLADTITVLAGGSVVATGTSAELKSVVGKRSVHLTLTTAADVDAAAAGLRGLGMQVHTDAARATVSTPVDAASDLAVVMRFLDEARIEFKELDLTEPTLDDVYLSLTADRAKAEVRG